MVSLLRLGCFSALIFGMIVPAASQAPYSASSPASTFEEAAPGSLPVIPALTVVALTFDAELGSKLSRSGDTFPIILSEPITLEGREVVAAGTRGMGEVVHAKKAGGGGAPGELVLAARYLQMGDRQIRLRSLNYEAVGKDKIGSATKVGIAGGVLLGPVAALGGLLMKGGEKTVERGSAGHAKTAEDFSLGAPAPPVPTN